MQISKGQKITIICTEGNKVTGIVIEKYNNGRFVLQTEEGWEWDCNRGTEIVEKYVIEEMYSKTFNMTCNIEFVVNQKGQYKHTDLSIEGFVPKWQKIKKQVKADWLWVMSEKWHFA